MKNKKHYIVLRIEDNQLINSGFDYTDYLPQGNKPGKWTPKIPAAKIEDSHYKVSTNWIFALYGEMLEEVRIFEVDVKGKTCIEHVAGTSPETLCQTIRLVKEITKTCVRRIKYYEDRALDNLPPRPNYNIGYQNSRGPNVGNLNTGTRNKGNCNTGHGNIGDFNAGVYNVGHRNSGVYNIGNENTGDRNIGNYNTGSFNIGDRNCGCFNTISPKCYFFNKETDVDARSIPWPLWILRVKYPEKEMFKREFSMATVQDVILTLELPNFDYKVFEEITGISKADFNRKLRNNEERQKRD